METIRDISYEEAIEFLLPRHYSGRKPCVSRAFGWIVDGVLQAVITYGKPVNRCLCTGICGEEWSSHVYELNRMCRRDGFDRPMSHFVSTTLHMLKPLDWIVVSYSDTAMNHHGYVYQACNFLYTGTSCTTFKDKYNKGVDTHNRHNGAFSIKTDGFYVERSPKHRYVYFCASSKAMRKRMEKALNYPVLPYPKGDNSNYELGRFIGKTVVDLTTGERTSIMNDRRIDVTAGQDFLF